MAVNKQAQGGPAFYLEAASSSPSPDHGSSHCHLIRQAPRSGHETNNLVTSCHMSLARLVYVTLVSCPDPTHGHKGRGSGYCALQVSCQRKELENVKMTNQNWGDVICDGSNWSVLKYKLHFCWQGTCKPQYTSRISWASGSTEAL